MFSASPQWTVCCQRTEWAHASHSYTQGKNPVQPHVWKQTAMNVPFGVGQCSPILGDKWACWQSARRRKLRGKWSVRLSRGLDSSKKGRLFIVWVCLQTHCADIRHVLSLFFKKCPMNTHKNNSRLRAQNRKVSNDHVYSEDQISLESVQSY